MQAEEQEDRSQKALDKSANAVSKWKQRKAERNESPLAAAQSNRGESYPGMATRLKDGSGKSVMAVVNGVKVAETAIPQQVNNRVYFPIEECAVEFFQDSPKRWRWARGEQVWFDLVIPSVVIKEAAW